MAVAHRWLPAFHRSADCEEVLSANGYNAHHIYREFIEQFAERPEDVAIHKLCYVEYCKVMATGAPILSGHPRECQSLHYRSALLDESCLALAKRAGFNDVKTWLAVSKPIYWETEQDPLLRAKSYRFILQGQDVFRHYQDSFNEQARIAIEEEASRFPQGEAGSFLPQNRLDAFRSISQSCLTHLGFRPAAARLKNYVALDLDVSDDLVLRWSIGEEDSFFVINFPAYCRPTLHLRQRSFKKKIRNADQEARLLQFRFHMLVEGVNEVYCRCFDIKELEVLIRVHALIVEWALSHILDAVRSA